MASRRDGDGERRPTEAEHRARRATALAAVIDLALHASGFNPFAEGAAIAKGIRDVATDAKGWAQLADIAKIGKPPSPKTIEAVAQIYEMRAAAANDTRKG